MVIVFKRIILLLLLLLDFMLAFQIHTHTNTIQIIHLAIAQENTVSIITNTEQNKPEICINCTHRRRSNSFNVVAGLVFSWVFFLIRGYLFILYSKLPSTISTGNDKKSHKITNSDKKKQQQHNNNNTLKTISKSRANYL